MSSNNQCQLKVLIWDAFHLESDEIIHQYIDMIVRELESHGHKALVTKDKNEAADLISDVDIMVGWRILPEVYAQAKRLKWIQFGSSGIDHTIFSELLASDVIITTLAGIHKTPVAEHVLALMLAMSRKIDVAVRQQPGHIYDRNLIAPFADELYGKTVGIIGLGRIGLEIARLCKCFGMSVIGTKRTADVKPEYVDQVFLPLGLDTVIERSDYLVLVAPLTGDTKSLIGAREIGLMKPSARIINVARGAMIDETALIDALRLNRIAGAGLDVFAHEPLPADSDLYDLPNVIITPHVAGAHPSYAERAFEIFKDNLHAFETGSPMTNVYNRSRRY